MTALLLLGLALALAGCALYSGSEIATYTLSRLRLETEARSGLRSARILERLLHDEVALLVTLLVGNNLTIQLLSLGSESLALRLGLPAKGSEVVVTLALTPLLFLFGELLPKDLFRRRAHGLMPVFAPFLAASRIAYLPLAWPLARLVRVLERALGTSGAGVEVARGRGTVQLLLAEGKAAGSIPADAEVMVNNVLALAETQVGRVMVPWSDVDRVTAGDPAAFAVVSRSSFTRLVVLEPGAPDESPAEGATPGAVRGYVHQIDVLAGGPDVPLEEHLRPIPEVGADDTIDRALARLRVRGQRLALVGSRTDPIGIVTLKDLVEEISGDLGRW